jgi:hypothetical protein
MDIQDLYELVPELACPPGCIECCRCFGIAHRTEIEDRRLRTFLQENGMEQLEADGTGCPYVTDRGCSVYPVRPLICRIYGVSPNYLCMLGVRPLRLLHEDEEAEIFHLYRTRFFWGRRS